MRLPAGWVDRTVLTYVGPDAGGGSPSIVVSRDQLGGAVSPGRYASMQDAAIRSGLEGVELIDQRETTVAGSHPAVALTYRWTLDGRTMRQRIWCLVVGEVGHAIVATAPDDEFDGLRGTFARAVDSFSPAG